MNLDSDPAIEVMNLFLMSDNTHNMKQLITDQLIEEYQKELETLNKAIMGALFSDTGLIIMQSKIDCITQFIYSLQSKRQQEVQNIIDAYKDGDVLKHLYKDNDDYFTQTFKQ